MEALRFGNADIAMNIDGGPAGSDGHTVWMLWLLIQSIWSAYYDAHAWVKAGSELLRHGDDSTDPFSLLQC